MLDDLPPFMTVEQAAEVLQLGRSKTYELTVEWECTSGARGLPFVRFGSQKRIPRAALVQLIEATLTRPPAA
jgi:excisionase family DNA binding protein